MGIASSVHDFAGAVHRARQRLITFLKTGVLMTLWLSSTALAAPGLAGGDVTAGPGDEVFLPVDFDADGSAVALQFDVSYDAQAMTLTSATPGGALVDHVLDFQSIAPGLARVVVTSASRAVLLPGRLADLRFQVSAQAAQGAYPATWQAVLISDDQSQSLPPSPLIDGVVRVQVPVVNPPPPPPPAASPGGGPAVPVPGLSALGLALLGALVLGLACLFLRHGARGVVLSLMTASVLLSSVVRAQVLPGDANDDGEVNAADIPVIVDEIQERAEAPGNPDCNQDQLVNVLDTVCVSQSEPQPDNNPPSLDAIDDQFVREGDLVAFTATAGDPDLPGDELSWRLMDGPAGSLVDAREGTFSWATGVGDAGAHPVTLRVVDQYGLADQQVFTVNVRALGAAPVLDAIPDQALVWGDALAVDAQATDPDLPDDTLQFSLAQAPGGLAIDGASGAITWSPGQGDLGTHDVTVVVTDQEGLLDYGAFIVDVRDPNAAPVAADDVFEARLGVPLAIDPAGVLDNDSDPNGDPLTAIGVDPAEQGVLTLNADGSFEYLLEPTDISSSEVELEIFCDNSRTPDSLGSEHVVDSEYQANYTPMVGDVDNDGELEIVASGWVGGGRSFVAEMWIMNAADCTDEFHTDGAFESLGTFDQAPLGLHDIDGDGDLEIIGSRERYPGETENDIGGFDGEHLLAVHHDGTPAWPGNGGSETTLVMTDNNSQTGYTHSGPTFVDLEGDGTMEIVMAGAIGFNWATRSFVVVYNAVDGTIKWEHLAEVNQSNHGGARMPYVVDLDLDGTMEVIVHNSVIDHTGQLEFVLPSLVNDVSTLFEGHLVLGIGNFDDDPYPELVGRDAHFYYRFEHDGTKTWEIPARNNSLTQLSVADFDGDGVLEFADIGCTDYVYNCGTFAIQVFETSGDCAPDCAVEDLLIWDHGDNPDWTSDFLLGQRSNLTAFDANRDGAFDLVYRNDASDTLYIFDGRDGSELVSVPAPDYHHRQSFTTVVDLDGDGHAEIINSYTGGITGQTEIWTGTVDNPLGTASPYRHQWGFHEAYVNDDLTIPSHPVPHWLRPGLNGWNMIMPAPHPLAGTTDRFTYRASDGVFESHLATVTLDILPAGNPPRFLSEPDTRTTRGFRYGYAPIVVDPDLGDVVSFHLTAGPDGMGIDPGTGAIDWLPPSVGDYEVSILATDSIGYAASQAFTLEVGDPVTVPDVVGMALAVAESTLDGASLAPGRVRQATHPTAPAGTVFEQSPPAGSVAPFGGAVDLAVSLGPSPADRDDDGDGFSPNQGDCDDDDDATYPGAADAADDAIDQDCDGVDGSEPVSGLLVQPGLLHLLAGASERAQAWAEFADGSAQSVTTVADWSSDNPGVATVSAAGQIVAVAAGSATVTASLGAVNDSVAVTVTAVDPSDDNAPLALISAPVTGSTITAPVSVTGSATDDNLVRWDLTIRLAGEEIGVSLAGGTGPVDDGVLGQLDPTLLLNGVYVLRLAVLDAGGNLSEDEVDILVDGEMKAGHFTLTFEDLEVPIGGLPLTVNRIYDSRDKRVGDFGTGWRLGVGAVDMSCSDRLSEGWHVTRSGLSYRLQATRPHSCMVLLPGLRPLVFDLVMSPDVSPVVPFPSSAIRARFVPRAGDQGTLTVLGNDTLSIFDAQPGPATLADDLTGLPWTPERFVYRTPEGSEFTIRPGDGLEQVRDANGNTLNFGPDGITHSAGQSVTFERNGAGRITSLTDPNGNVQRYAYDSHGDLARHTDATGASTRFRYDARRHLVNITDALGARAVLNEYDDQGRLVATVDANGHRTEFAVDLDARQVTTFDPDGRSLVRAFDDAGNILSEQRTVTIEGVPTVALTTYSYDADGRQASTVDPDGVRNEFLYDAEGNLSRLLTMTPTGDLALEQTYDDQGRVTRRTDVGGEVTEMAYDARGNLVESRDTFGGTYRHFYDAAGRQIATIDANGNREDKAFTPQGRISRRDRFAADGTHLSRMDFDYDANGNLVGTTAYADPVNGLGAVSRSYQYDAAGRRVLATDAAGNDWRYEYDAAGHLVAEIDPFGQRTEYGHDAMGQVTVTRWADGTETRTEYDAFGNEVRVVDQLGRETRYEYDEAGRRTAAVHPDGGRVEMVYTPGGRLAATIDQAGARTDYEYDTAGRLVRVLGPSVEVDLGGVTERPRIQTTYDAAGRAVETIDANGFVTRVDHDLAGREIGRTFPDSASISQQYDPNGNVVQTTDPMGLVTDYLFDGLDRLISVEQPAPGPGEPGPTVSSNTYDRLGNRVGQVDALGRVTRFTHNVLGEVTSRTLPGGQVEQFVYERGLRLAGSIDFNGRTTTVEYDALHRPVRFTYQDGVVEETVYTATGQVASVSGELGVTEYQYDAMDRLIGVRQPSGAEVGYTYTPRGEVASVSVDGDRVATYVYDALGRLVEVDSDPGTSRYGYDLEGNQTVVEHANGASSQRSYDPMGRLRQVREFDASGVLIQQLDYTRDARGMRQSTDELDGSRETYGYDQLNRLTSRERTGTGAVTELFELDAVGNRTRVIDAQGDRQFSYDVNDRLISAGAVTFSYDDAGNRVGRNSPASQTDYEWDDRGHLVGVEENGFRTEYGYDGVGNRMSRRDATEAVDFVLDPASVTGLSQVIEHREPGGDVLAETVFGTAPLYATEGGVTRFLHSDALGSTTLTTDAVGDEEAKHRYASYGQPETAGTDELPLGYTGQQYDSQTGLQFLRARYYDPTTGVFLSEDPLLGDLGDPVTRHRYLYAASNPMNFHDPTGGQYTLANLSLGQAISNGLKLSSAAGFVCSALGIAENTATVKSLFNLAVTGAKYVKNGSLPKDAKATLIDVNDPSSRVGIQKLKVELTAKGVLSVAAKADGKPEVRFKVNLKTGRVYGGGAGQLDATLIKLRKCGGGVDLKLELLAKSGGKTGKVSDVGLGALAKSPTGFRVVGEFILGPASIKKWTFAEVPPDGIESVFADIEKRKNVFILSRYRLDPYE